MHVSHIKVCIDQAESREFVELKTNLLSTHADFKQDPAQCRNIAHEILVCLYLCKIDYV